MRAIGEARLRRALRYIVGSVFAGLAAMVAWSLISVALTFVGFEIYSVQTEGTMIAAFIIGAGTAIAIGIGRSNRKSIAEAERQQEQEARATEAKRFALESLRATAMTEAQQGVQAFSRMPIHLQEAARSYSRASKTFRDGAFSPFWTAVEAAYGSLASYDADARQVATCAIHYMHAVQMLAEAGALSPELSTFPVTLDAQRVKDQQNTVLRKLDAIVYEAQKQPTFATIWEQRRTTAAVVAGFRNLEDAVARMGAQLTASVDQLGKAADSATQAVRSASVDTQWAVAMASLDQQAQVRQLNEKAAQVRDALYYPELTRWLA